MVCALAGWAAGPWVRSLIVGSSGRRCTARPGPIAAGTSVSCAAAAVHADSGVHLLVLLWFALAGTVLVVVDAETLRLPNRIVLPGWAIVSGGLAVETLRSGAPERLAVALLAGGAGVAAYLMPALVEPPLMGMGDVKLVGATATLLGWSGWDAVVAGLGGGLLLGGSFSAVLLLRGRVGPREVMPFGPFLVAGTWIGLGVG